MGFEIDTRTLGLSLVLICIIAWIMWRDESTSDQNPTLETIRERLTLIHPEFGKIPLRLTTDGAYTENKAIIYICIHDPRTNTTYSMNMLMYVAIHELAHVISKSHGHGDEFKKNFSLLLKHAENKGVFDSSQEIVQNYCGVTH